MWRRGIAVMVAATVVVGCNSEKKSPSADTTHASAPKAG